MSEGLRRFVGQVEVINRGLHTLSVDQSTFGSLLIPILLGKLPEDIKSQVTRFISLEIWNLKELLDLLNKDVEARDKCAFSAQSVRQFWKEVHQILQQVHL